MLGTTLLLISTIMVSYASFAQENVFGPCDFRTCSANDDEVSQLSVDIAPSHAAVQVAFSECLGHSKILRDTDVACENGLGVAWFSKSCLRSCDSYTQGDHALSNPTTYADTKAGGLYARDRPKNLLHPDWVVYNYD